MASCVNIKNMSSSSDMENVPTIPNNLEQFTPSWAKEVMRKWFVKNEICPESVKISLVEPRVNSEQVKGCFKNLIQAH